MIEPATEFSDNWHIDLIAQHLEAVTRGEVRKLVVNIPPRHMKSLLVAVFWPAWVWLQRPSARFLFASYAGTLSIKHSVICRRLILSPWYQQRWGDRFALEDDQNVKLKFDTTATGFRLATSVEGVATGEGGDFVVVDDPHNVTEGESEAKRQGAIDWWDGTMSTRLNSPEAARVVVQQRVHEADLSGHLLREDEETGEPSDWAHLVLPAEYDPEHPYVHADDPRTEPGEPLWPAHWDAAWLEEKKRELGSYKYAGQFQQLPAPAAGGILKRYWWRYYEPGRWPQFQEIVTSWDMAFKDTDGSDYVAGGVWGRDGANKYLLRQRYGRLDYPATKAALREEVAWVHARWPSLPHSILVEDKANGSAVIADLRNEIAGLIAVEPEGGKLTRAHAAAPELEAGNFHVPGAPRHDRDGKVVGYDPAVTPPWVQGFIDECGTFPKGAHDDQVDQFTQAAIRLRGGGGAGSISTGGYASGRGSDR